jgi:hypothetical protein
MKSIHKYIGLIAISITLASCEKEIVVDVPVYQPKLVLSSYSVAGDTVYVAVGKSIGILDYKYGKDLEINNAALILKADGMPDDVLEYDPMIRAYRSHSIAQTGKSYTLTATAPGYTEATAVTTVPSIVTIDSIRRIPNAKLDIDGNQQDELRIIFKDPPTAGDFYILSISSLLGVDTNFHSNGIGCVNTTDASIESIYDESIDQNTCLQGDAIFFRDMLFNGTTKELRLFVPSGAISPSTMFGDTVYAQVQLLHVTESYFRFNKSYRFASDNRGNPFAEPTNVYTNVNNGYGVFSMMSVDLKEVK